MCDILIVIASSLGAGDPPADFGAFFFALLTQATATTVDDGLHLAGLQHALLGVGHAQCEGSTFQNIPRLTDRYLGECGSRRLAMRVEIDAALEGGDAQRDAFAASTFEALQAMPSHGLPPVCAWTEARGCNVAARADFVTPKSVAELEAYKPSESEWGDFEGPMKWPLLLLGIAACCAFVYWINTVLIPTL